MNIEKSEISTPCFVLDLNALQNSCKRVEAKALEHDLEFLFPIKCFNNIFGLNIISNYCNGFSASSPFETMLSRQILGENKTVSYMSPYLTDRNITEIAATCGSISFNSLSQWNRFKFSTINTTSPALRINPQMSFVQDKRYDPCEKHSKLGVPLDILTQEIKRDISQFAELEGLHFHTNSESTDFTQLLDTVVHLDRSISQLLKKVKWINLGGGYYFDDGLNYEPFEKAIDLLKSKYCLTVIIEPGTALVQKAVSLVSSVIDLFESSGKTIVILDTTVNHLPEVLEFQYTPDAEGCTNDGQFEYILAGASCLTGDKFGTYRFDHPLGIGDWVTLRNVGSYSLVKGHMFNGINLPIVYCKQENGRIELLKEYTYEDFLDRCGAGINERLRKRA